MYQRRDGNRVTTRTSIDIVINCKRFLVLLPFICIVASCRQNDHPPITAPAAPEIVSSTPPFPTKEPDHYRATRTISQTEPGGKTITIKTNILRAGPSRREELESPDSPTLVYLEKAGERFLLLPDAKIYSTVDAQFAMPGSLDDNATESSPDRVLHTEAIQTTYQKLPDEVLEGKSVGKYKVTVNANTGRSVSNSVTLVWVDEKLGMPVKTEMSSTNGSRTTMQLSAISLEVNAADFEIPAGYKKVATHELLGHAKRTD
jgi:hypothetical protein